MFQSTILKGYAIDEGGRFWSGSGDIADDDARADLILFAMDTCPHCKHFMRTWSAIMRFFEDSSTVKCTLLEVTDTQGRAKAQKHRINTVPTLLLHLHDRKNAIKYDGDMKKDSIVEWVNGKILRTQR